MKALLHSLTLLIVCSALAEEPKATTDGPSASSLASLSRMTPDELEKVAAFLQQHGDNLKTMTEEERQTFFRKETSKAAALQRGPGDHNISLFNKLSEAGKSKFKEALQKSRETISKMSPKDRQNFMHEKLTAIAAEDKAQPPAQDTTMPTLLNLPIKDIDGKDTSLAELKGKAYLIVNVASQCGYTGQYAGLEDLWKEYKDKGLVVVGVPCNDFGGQEPGTAEEIKTFCSSSYNVTFPLMEKVTITSGTAHPLYAALTAEGRSVGWNFTKFLVSKDGKEIKKFEPDVEPSAAELKEAIEAAIK